MALRPSNLSRAPGVSTREHGCSAEDHSSSKSLTFFHKSKSRRCGDLTSRSRRASNSRITHEPFALYGLAALVQQKPPASTRMWRRNKGKPAESRRSTDLDAVGRGEIVALFIHRIDEEANDPQITLLEIARNDGEFKSTHHR